MHLFKKRINARIRIIFSSLCASALLLVLLCLSLKTSQPNPAQLTSNPVEPLAYTCCTPLNNSFRTNVFFVKTHKTGGTTVENVLIRFALRNSLDVLNIAYNMYYMPLSDFSIWPNTNTPSNKYHVMAQHLRYTSTLKSYQYPDTSTVTILRHPVTHFKSKYDFFQIYLTTGMSLQQFLNAPIKPPLLLGVDSFMAYRGYNQMSVDLGFDAIQSKNQTAIAEFIEKIDREFDLVMIMEYMDASMILLANLMGWPLENMAYLKMNARLPGSDDYKLTLRDEITIMDLNEVDTLLYHHFRNKFLKCVRQYGERKMKDQIQQLKSINEQFARKCVADDVKQGVWYGVPKTVDYAPKNQSDLECVYAVTPQNTLDSIVRDIQFKRFKV
ncbi:galactose-3-O-sulfotransferase 3-like [Planococcus citri]|uniref:galactose-3-O-sulfotransferase 3-like n=1 Tax=Planococcus citri TaxID=170843 RepID=UPI0031F926F9